MEPQTSLPANSKAILMDLVKCLFCGTAKAGTKRFLCSRSHHLCYQCLDEAEHQGMYCPECANADKKYSRLMRDRTAEDIIEEADMEDVVSCPICTAIPIGKMVFLCPNSHRLCNFCLASLRAPERCPTCRAGYARMAPVDHTAMGAVKALGMGVRCANGGCDYVAATEAEAPR